MEVVVFIGIIRIEVGKKVIKVVCVVGEIFVILYSKNGNIYFSIIYKVVKLLIFMFEFCVVEIELDGKVVCVIVKDIQWDLVMDEIVYIDFLELIDGYLVKLEIFVVFVGNVFGICVGGKLLQLMCCVKVKIIFENIINELKLDIFFLEFG